jgi:hypothetical protein
MQSVGLGGGHCSSLCQLRQRLLQMTIVAQVPIETLLISLLQLYLIPNAFFLVFLVLIILPILSTNSLFDVRIAQCGE